jgi:hypothetical protein
LFRLVVNSLYGELHTEKSTYGYGKICSWEYYDKFGILMSGINISQAMLMFRHMNLATISVRTYHIHQSIHLFPAVLKHWEVYQSGLIEEVKESGEESQHGQEMDVLILWVIALSMVCIPCGAIQHQNWSTLNYFRYNFIVMIYL